MELKSHGYSPQSYIQKSLYLQTIFDMMKHDFFSPMEHGIFDPLIHNLSVVDPYLVCADFDDYCAIQDRISEEYRDQDQWIEKAIVNVAKAGKFSSDRTIVEYSRDIWDIPVRGNP